MIGIRSDCELVYAYLGGFAGLLTGILVRIEGMAPLGSAESGGGILLTALFALSVVCTIFAVFFRKRFWRLLVSLVLPSILLAAVVYAVGTVFTSGIGQPFILFFIGVVLGSAFGRVLCARCEPPKKILISRD